MASSIEQSVTWIVPTVVIHKGVEEELNLGKAPGGRERLQHPLGDLRVIGRGDSLAVTGKLHVSGEP